MAENERAPTLPPQFRLSVPVDIYPAIGRDAKPGNLMASLHCSCDGLEREAFEGRGASAEEAVDDLVRQMNEHRETGWEVWCIGGKRKTTSTPPEQQFATKMLGAQVSPLYPDGRVWIGRIMACVPEAEGDELWLVALVTGGDESEPRKFRMRLRFLNGLVPETSAWTDITNPEEPIKLAGFGLH